MRVWGHGVGNALFGLESSDLLQRLLAGDSHHEEFVGLVLLPDFFLEERDFGAARPTPSGPKVDKDDLASEILHADLLASRVAKCERGHLLANFGACFIGVVLWG